MSAHPQQPRPPGFGEAAPWFSCPTPTRPEFHVHSLGGMVLLLLFVGSLSDAEARAAYEQVMAGRDLFDDRDIAFFAVSTDPSDHAAGRLRQQLPGVRWFIDFDRAVSDLYGVRYDAPESPRVFVLDEMLRVAASAPLSQTGSILEGLRTRLQVQRRWWREQTAPVLTTPNVFEPQFCQALIAHYEARGGTPSGFMQSANGAEVGRYDPKVKRRRDVMIEDPALKHAVRERLRLRLSPMLERSFGWRPTHVERYLIACYAEDEQGFFSAHRDNTGPATAHRKFAVTINLNGDFAGGELRFPEFGPRTYRPPPGGATVFACGLLHEATPVTQGRRFAFLPFLLDESAAELQDATRHLIQDAPDPAQEEAAPT